MPSQTEIVRMEEVSITVSTTVNFFNHQNCLSGGQIGLFFEWSIQRGNTKADKRIEASSFDFKMFLHSDFAAFVHGFSSGRRKSNRKVSRKKDSESDCRAPCSRYFLSLGSRIKSHSGIGRRCDALFGPHADGSGSL